jgi:hypothetical protein
MLEPRADAFSVHRVTEEGVTEDVLPQIMRNTLFSVLWSPDKASLLRVDRPRGEDQLELEASRMRLVSQLQQLPEDLKVLGAGNGLKRGKTWSARSDVVEWTRQHWFSTAEEALSYGSLLFSENRAIYECAGAGIYEEEGPDGQGLIDADWLVQQDLPVRQVQVRAAWPNTLAKGTLKPCWGLRESSGHSFLFHPTTLKGRTVDIDGEFILGVRDIAEQRVFRSGWTVTQWLSDSVKRTLWERYAIEVLSHLEEAFASTEGALRLLAALPRNGDNEARDLLHLLLHSGLEPSHPWLRTNLKRHCRQAYIDVALGLGVPLQGGMACWMGALQDNKVAVPWLPVGAELVIGRYPIRDGWSMRVVKNTVAPVPEGSIGANERLLQSLDGDVDGDYVFVIQDPDVVQDIKQLHETAPPRLERGSKTRKRTTLKGMERVAVEAMGATGLGSATWLVAGALSACRADLVPVLSDQVQSAVESFKWSTEVDWDLLGQIEAEVELPEYLQLGQRKTTFLEEAPRISPCGGFEVFWNRACEHWEEHVLEGKKSLRDFIDLLPSPSGSCVMEAELVRDYYNSAVVNSGGDEDVIRSAVNLVRAWGQGKDGDREDWAATCWHLAHKSTHPRATGSFGLHGFPNELAQLLGLEEQQALPALPPSFPGLRIEVKDEGLYVNERRVPFEPLTYRRRNNGSVKTECLPVVGGWRARAEKDELTETEAVVAMRQLAEQWRGKTVSVVLKLEDVSWADVPVVNAYCGGHLLGCVAPELAERVYDRVDEPVDALLSMRGRTVYAVLVA